MHSQVHSEFCCEPPCSSHKLCRKFSELSYSISSQGLGSFFQVLLSRSSSHRHKERWISVHLRLTLEASEMFLSLHMIFRLDLHIIFRLEGAAVLGCPGRNLVFCLFICFPYQTRNQNQRFFVLHEMSCLGLGHEALVR